MPRYINTYSKSRPIFRKAERDVFSELTRSKVKGAINPIGLELIAESENEDDCENKKLVKHSKARVRTTRAGEFIPSRSTSHWKPSHLKIEGKPIKGRKTSPFVTPDQTEDTYDDSILFMSDTSEDSSTLSDTEVTVQHSGGNDDSYSQYSDPEMPRDLPEDKRKSRSVSTQILKLSQVSNVQPSKFKSQKQGLQRKEKAAHSTLLEGKLSSMCIDQYGISDISGNGTEYHISDSSAIPLETEACSRTSETTKRSSKLAAALKQNESKHTKDQMEREMASRRSVYSLNSSDDDSSLHSIASRQQDGSSLKVTGKKVALGKKNQQTRFLTKQSKNNSRDRSLQNSKRVSFLLGTKPEFFEPSQPSIVAPSPIPLPHLSPSSSILKKKNNTDSHIQQEGKLIRATSTPQKLAAYSRRKHGCHIMDLSFDVSAVALPSDSDLIIPPNSPNKENVPDCLATVAGNTGSAGERTEKLLDFEPICLEASQNLDSLLETTAMEAIQQEASQVKSTPVMGTQQEATPVKPTQVKDTQVEASQVKPDATRENRGEMTPCTQVKRGSPDANKPSKHLAKKSRIIKPVKKASPRNRKRLSYQPLPAVNLVPECVITQLPFTGYKHTPPTGIVQPVSAGQAMDVENFPQDVLETVPESVFIQPNSSVGCNV